MIRVSIVVPMHNAARSLGACLEALFHQDVPPDSFEVIVVDNGSDDGSPEVAQRHPAVRLMAEPHRGAYAARNRGIRAARGSLIAFIDADCIARPDWLDRLDARLTATPGTHVVMGRDIPTGPSLAIRLLGLYDHAKEAFVLSSDDPAIYYGHTNCMLTRRETLEAMGFFDPRPRGADVIFVHRVLERHGTRAVQYAPDAVVNHLEVHSAGVYFKKSFIYGRSARAYCRVVRARPLRLPERLQIFRTVVRDTPLTGLEAVYLFVLLTIGVAAFGLGWFCSRPSEPAPATHESAPVEVDP